MDIYCIFNQQISIANALKFIRNPVRCCKHIYNLIKALNRAIEENREEYEDTGISCLQV